MQIVNPTNNQIIATLTADDQNSLDHKLINLKNHKPDTSLEQRKAGILGFSQALLKNSEDLAQTLCSEMGKPIKQARAEIKDTAKRAHFFVDNIDKISQVRKLSPNEEISFEPLPMILCISAWNYPYFVSTNVVLPALLAGCRVMFKPSELATLSGQKMVELLWAQVPFKHSLQIGLGGKEVGSMLVQKDFDAVFFTGSEKAGQNIKSALGSRMVKSQFELGGKDAAYIRHDANLAKAVASVLDGAFYNCGQSCCSIERIYVHKDIAVKFKNLFLESAKNIKMGDPTDENTYLGPLARREQINFLLEQIADAQKKGATIALGGTALPSPGNYFKPTVIFDANCQMSVMTEESFGPIVAIEEVNSDDEALEKINSSRFGLTASVFSENEMAAKSILNNIDVGSVYWNGCDKVSSALPWSGRKNSGLGLTLSSMGLQMFFRPKAWYL